MPAEMRPFHLEDIRKCFLENPFDLEGIRKRLLGKPCLNHPAKTLRCSPVSAVRPILYSNLQSDNTKFLHFVPFCFFRWRTAVSCFSSIDRFQLVCFAGEQLVPLHPSAKLNQLDHSLLVLYSADSSGSMVSAASSGTSSTVSSAVSST